MIDVLPPTDAELEAIAQMPDVAPEGMQEAAEAYADWNAAIQQGLADPLDEDVEALLAEVSDEELSAASRALWTFGVEHCGLADPAGLTGPSSEGILGGRNDAEREDGETDGPLDPDSIRADLTAAEDAAVKAILVARGSAGAHVQIVVAASAGQEGAMTVCEAVSTYLYDGIEERRVGISIEADDLSFWASRFNDTADCQSGS